MNRCTLKSIGHKHLLFLIFALSIFLKVVAFRIATAHLDLLDTLREYPGNFLVFWIGKLLPAVVIASFVYITRQKWWTIVDSLLIDLWIISNLLYFKANGLYLTPEAIMMAGNLHGFENSVLALLGWDVYAILLITAAYIVSCIAIDYLPTIQQKKLYKRLFFIYISLALLADCWSNYHFNPDYYLEKEYGVTPPTFDVRITHAWPFGLVYYHTVSKVRYEACDTGQLYNGFAHDHLYFQSVISFLPAMWLFDLWEQKDVTLTDEQKRTLDDYFKGKDKAHKSITPTQNLLFILVESLESWPWEKVCGHDYMPWLSQFIGQEHVFYAEKLKSQVLHGVSGDGQLICMTGLLPIQRGIACIHYGGNTYPNFTSSYEYTVAMNPSKGYWNKTEIFPKYGFLNLVEPEADWTNDEWTARQTIHAIDSLQDSQPFCLLSLTITSHIPFTYGADHPKHQVEGMPKTMADYLNCLAYTDSCIALVVDRVLQDSALADNTTIVITGDHTAFRTSAFKDMEEYATVHGIDFKVGKNYVPLIIYSPDIEGNERYDGEAYQMDVFPMVCALIDSASHVPSFGVNLRDSVALANRPVTEEEAYRLSDLIIRSNYFGEKKQDE